MALITDSRGFYGVSHAQNTVAAPGFLPAGAKARGAPPSQPATLVLSALNKLKININTSVETNTSTTVFKYFSKYYNLDEYSNAI